jgi:hypothetical protein
MCVQVYGGAGRRARKISWRAVEQPGAPPFASARNGMLCRGPRHVMGCCAGAPARNGMFCRPLWHAERNLPRRVLGHPVARRGRILKFGESGPHRKQNRHVAVLLSV